MQLKAAREAKSLSLADLTELTGMDRSALSKLETGQRANPTVETLVRMPKLWVSVSWFRSPTHRKSDSGQPLLFFGADTHFIMVIVAVSIFMERSKPIPRRRKGLRNLYRSEKVPETFLTPGVGRACVSPG